MAAPRPNYSRADATAAAYAADFSHTPLRLSSLNAASSLALADYRRETGRRPTAVDALRVHLRVNEKTQRYTDKIALRFQRNVGDYARSNEELFFYA
jgi:hypothetical protein